MFSEEAEMKIKDFVRGEGPEVSPGYRRGDSWVQTLALTLTARIRSK